MVIPPCPSRVVVRWRFKRWGFMLEGVYGHDADTSHSKLNRDFETIVIRG
jgi:hypothetical protein